MHKYKCCVAPADELVAYVTDMEPYHGDLFALVTTNADKGKISVLLDIGQALDLRAQLTQYIGDNHGLPTASQ